MYTYDTIHVVCSYARPRSSDALTCRVHSYLNLSKLLPILRTKARYARDNTAVISTSCSRSISGLLPQILCSRSILRFRTILSILRSRYFRARTNSEFATSAALVTPCCVSSISGFCTAGTASTSLAVFRPLVMFVLLLRVVAVPKYSQYAQHTSSMT